MNRLLLAAAAAAVLAPAAGRAADPVVYRIGISRSSFRDIPAPLLALAGQPFEDLMRAHTGLVGKVNLDHEWAGVLRDLDAGKLHLGVFQGHEYAWALEKCPDLRPLVCSVYRPREVKALILVRHDAKAAGLADLKGARLALAATVKDHVKLFLETRRAAELGGSGFGPAARTDTVHDAIEKVMDREADLTAADAASWNYYQKLYPGPSKNLRVLAASDEFPPTVLVYKKGALDEPVLKKLRDGFLTAHQNPKGARMMSLIRMEKFEAVADGFEESVKSCLKAYPPPAEK